MGGGFARFLRSRINPRLVPPSPSRFIRAAIALGVALASVAYVVAYARVNPDFVSDFDQLWAAGRALWRGADPYHVVGPRGSFLWKWPLYYPAPAILVVAPLGLVSVVAARAIFTAISTGLFAYAITRHGYDRLLLLLSISFVTAVELVQWSPLLTAAMLLPSAAWLAVAKPNLGAAMAAYASSRRVFVTMIAGGVLLVAASILMLPTWPREWWDNVRSAPHFIAPVVRPAGFLLLAVLARWRRPEARLLAALACVPQTPTFYDHVLVFVVARSAREALVLVVLTFVVYFAVAFAAPFDTFQQWGNFVANATMALIYAPAVIMVLRRPNEGTVPAFVDRVLARARPRAGNAA